MGGALITPTNSQIELNAIISRLSGIFANWNVVFGNGRRRRQWDYNNHNKRIQRDVSGQINEDFLQDLQVTVQIASECEGQLHTCLDRAAVNSFDFVQNAQEVNGGRSSGLFRIALDDGTKSCQREFSLCLQQANQELP